MPQRHDAAHNSYPPMPNLNDDKPGPNTELR